MKLLIVTYRSTNIYGINQVLKGLIPFLKRKIEVLQNINYFKFLFSNIDFIHIHGLWDLKFILFFITAKLKNKKVIISPHGMLDPESFKVKSFKKKIAFFFYQRLVLIGSDLIIVNSKKKKKNFLKKVNHKKVTVIPHGIILTKIKKKTNKGLLHSVYFSKIHPIKNLLQLVKIWSISKKLKKFKLTIYGEIDDGEYFNKINNIINKSKNIFYCGKIGSNKILNLSYYDIFIFPSKSENFGLVVLEALNAGLYLILNKTLPWKNLENNRFASFIKFNKKYLEDKIIFIERKKNFLLSNLFYKKKILYLKSNHSWQIISNKYIAQYKNLLF